MKKLAFPALATTLLLLVSRLLSAQISLDSTFGDNGFASFGYHQGRLTEFKFAALQNDDRIVAFGDLWSSERQRTLLARFGPDGQPDPGFGDQGIARLYSDGPSESPAGLFILPGGSIETATVFYLNGGLRLKIKHWTPDGQPDAAFGELLSPELSPGGYFTKLIRQPDGWLVAGARTYWPLSEQSDLFVARLKSDGGLDPNFGNNGIQLIDYEGKSDLATDMEQAPNGKIFLLADSREGSSQNNYLARLLPNGQPDPQFGWFGDGLQYIGTFLPLNDLAIPDNDYLYLGGATTFDPTGLCVYRLSSYNGQRDESFGSLGRAIVPLPLPGSFKKILPLPNGDVLAAGTNYADGIARQVIARFDMNGHLVPGFGNSNGYTVAGSQQFPAMLDDCLLTPSGDIVTAGLSYEDGAGFLRGSILRLTAQGLPDPDFAGGQMTLYLEPRGDDFGRSIRALPNGELLVSGISEGDNANPTLLRLDASGQKLSVFGGPEGLGRPFPLEAGASGLSEALPLSNGFMFFAGVRAGQTQQFAELYSVRPDGSPNPGFGQNGIARIALPVGLINPYYTDCLLQPDGRVLVYGGGYVENAFPQWVLFFARFMPNGEPDGGFGENGSEIVFLPENSFAGSMTLQLDGKIVAVAHASGAVVFRLKPNGLVDGSFGESGATVLFPAFAEHRQSALNILPDGRLAVLCQSDTSLLGFALVTADGQNATVSSFELDGAFTLARELLVLPYGKMVFAVTTTNPDGLEQVQIVRLQPSGAIDPDGTLLLPSGPFGRRATALERLPGGQIAVTGAEFDGFSQNVFAARLTGDFQIEASDEFDSGLRLSVSPNPAREVLYVRFELTQPGTLRGELWNAAGQHLGNIFDVTEPAGVFEEIVRLPAGLAAGVYALKVTGDKGEKLLLPMVIR